MRNRRLRNDPQWLDDLNESKQLQDWAVRRNSDLIMVRSSFKLRSKARDIAASMIAIVKEYNIPIVWALASHLTSPERSPSPLDVLKYLVLQVLQLNQSLLMDGSKPLSAIQFRCARTEEEWFYLLAMVLVGISQIYFIIDIEILKKDFGDIVTWPAAFVGLFAKVAAESPATTVKLAII